MHSFRSFNPREDALSPRLDNCKFGLSDNSNTLNHEMQGTLCDEAGRGTKKA